MLCCCSGSMDAPPPPSPLKAPATRTPSPPPAAPSSPPPASPAAASTSESSPARRQAAESAVPSTNHQQGSSPVGPSTSQQAFVHPVGQTLQRQQAAGAGARDGGDEGQEQVLMDGADPGVKVLRIKKLVGAEKAFVFGGNAGSPASATGSQSGARMQVAVSGVRAGGGVVGGPGVKRRLCLGATPHRRRRMQGPSGERGCRLR